MALTINDWKVGDKVFFGSRWHVVSGVRVKGEKRNKWSDYKEERDFLNVYCGTGNYGCYAGKEPTFRKVPTEGEFRAESSENAKPVCVTCHGGRGGGRQHPRAIPVSLISDPDLRERIIRRLTNGYQRRWSFRLDDDTH
jgi:hypothetical protein